jgi:tRNA(Ile)-lysidine synthase TilS/MesJ
MTNQYDPTPLIPYMKSLGVPYFFESQAIIERAKDSCAMSICSWCSRMKRGALYAVCRREGYNVLVLGQHLDDLAESFVMSAFHNGFLRSMKANYVIE